MNIKNTLSEYFKISELKENITSIIEARVELKKLEIQEKIEPKIAKLVMKLILGSVAFLIFIILNMLIIKYINISNESTYLGETIFLIMYLIVAATLYFNKDILEKKLSSEIANVIDKETL